MRQVAGRNFEGACGEAQLGGGGADGLQTRPVAGGVAELADARETDVAAKVATDHGERSRAAVHLVDLLDERHPADSFSALAKQSDLVRERRIGFRCGPGVFARGRCRRVHRQFIQRLRAGGQHLERKIQRHARLSVGLVLRDALLHQPREVGELALQRQHGLGLEREQLTVLHRLGRGRPRHALEHGKLAEKSPSRRKARFLRTPLISAWTQTCPCWTMNIGPAGSPCRMMAWPLANWAGSRRDSRAESAGRGSRPKLLNW